MIDKLENFLQNIKGKEIIIDNTYEKDELGYNLAHILRNYCSKLYCCDSRYKMINEPKGYRVIENGHVVLIKGDLLLDVDKIYNIINKINNITSNISYEIHINDKTKTK